MHLFCKWGSCPVSHDDRIDGMVGDVRKAHTQPAIRDGELIRVLRQPALAEQDIAGLAEERVGPAVELPAPAGLLGAVAQLPVPEAVDVAHDGGQVLAHAQRLLLRQLARPVHSWKNSLAGDSGSGACVPARLSPQTSGSATAAWVTCAFAMR